MLHLLPHRFDCSRGYCSYQSSVPAFFTMARIWVLFLILGLGLGLGLGCTKTSAETWADMGYKASSQGFMPKTFDVYPFLLSGLLKGKPGSRDYLVVYIEGDGAALTAAKEIAFDPSPSQAQSYELALLDPAQAVLYLARIGQYQPGQTGPLYQKYWAEARFSNDAVEAASQAISQAKNQVGATYVHLVGFSGGGALATLLAERRGDVKSLVTIAALLDIDWWVDTFDYKPLLGSLNPADRAPMISSLPQIHINGKKDKIAPPEMLEQFEQKTDFRNFRIITLPNDHYSGWTKVWPQILRQYVIPMRNQTNDH